MFRRAPPLLLALILPVAALAQPRLEPVPPPPPAPVAPINDSALGETPVTISPGPDDKIEDIVVNGERALRVTTPDGSVYYLAPDQRDAGLRPFGDSGLRVPMQVIRQF